MKLKNYKIRLYEDTDILYIIDIDEQIFGRIQKFEAMTLKECLSSKKKHSFFVLEAGGTVAGYIIFNMTSGVIYRLCVYPPLWRNKLGTELLNKAKQLCESLHIWVDERNLGAQLFLKQNGFLWKETVDDEYKMFWSEINGYITKKA